MQLPNPWTLIKKEKWRDSCFILKSNFSEFNFQVHKANWYGDVAVKLLNMDHVDEEKQLEAFKVNFSCKFGMLRQLFYKLGRNINSVRKRRMISVG